jgi:nucleotide sugar dehydrogenase
MSTITVIGAGKIGFPLACHFARRGGQVIVCDIDAAVVERINRGESPVDEPGVADLVRGLVQTDRLAATTDTALAVSRSDAVVVVVPALLTDARDVDASAVQAASREIARTLRPRTLVSIETTMPVGGTRGFLLPILEAGGLRAGMDFDLACSPERVKSLHVLERLESTPKIVGGVTDASARHAVAFYERFLGAPVVNVGTLEAAEMVKLAGMVYRDVNIALANELAQYAENLGLDLPALLPAINSDGEAGLLQPGIGVGGHCTPVYPHFLIRGAQRAGAPATLAARARRINDRRPSLAIERLREKWGSLEGCAVLILGLAFRPGVREHLLSPAFALRDELRRWGARPFLHDPLYADEELRAHGFEPLALDAPCLPPIVILNTAHARYAEVDPASLAARGTRMLVDGRNVWSAAVARAAGLEYIGMGRGSAARDEVRPLPIARPALEDDEAEAAAGVVRSGWVLQGPEVAAFERELAAVVGAPHACAVSSGTAALHLALMAVGVGAGDEVITVSHSFIATANSVRHCGAMPVFVDIDRDSLNIDPRLVEAAITARTKAVLCVHQAGMPCDLRTLVALARAHGLRLVEDAACACGSEVHWGGDWQRIGRPHGDAACFSFHPRKLITTGDGGMIVTADPEVDRRARRLRQHGVESVGSGPLAEESYPVVGYNFRMTDVQGAIGRAQLRRLPALVAERRALAEVYRARLSRIDGLSLQAEPAWARSNWQSLLVRLPPGRPQPAVMSVLHARGITTKRGIVNAHEQPAYAGCARKPLVESERAYRECVALPLFPGMTIGEIDRVTEALAGAIGQSILANRFLINRGDR